MSNPKKQGGQQPSDEETVRNMEYYDETKIEAMKESFSMLERAVTDSSSVGAVTDNGHVVLRIQTAIKSYFFKINYIALSNQGANMLFYHAIILFEFIQLLFLIFFQVPTQNEFLPQVLVQSQGVQSITGLLNSLNSTSHQSAMNYAQQYSQPSFMLSDYFKFFTFTASTLSNPNQSDFLVVFVALVGLFYVHLILLLLLPRTLIDKAKQEQIKDGSVFYLKILSFVMLAFITLLKLPFTIALLQGLLCGENTSLQYAQSSLSCDSAYHIPFVVISVITLLAYAVYLIMQQMLFTSNNFDSELPWSQFSNRLNHYENIYKLMLSASFVFDKNGTTISYIQLVSSVICAAILIQRIQISVIYNESVYRAQQFYGILKVALFLTVPLHKLTNTPLNITLLALILLCCISLSFISYFTQYSKILSLAQSGVLQKINQPHQHELLLYRIFKLIESHHQRDKIILQGIMQYHFENCTNLNCTCRNVMQKLDRLKEHIQKKMEKEEFKSKQSMNKNTNDTMNINSNSVSLYHNAVTVQNQEENEETAQEASWKLKTLQAESENDDDEQCEYSEESIQRSYIKFLAMKCSKAAQQHPQSIDLKIILSLIEAKKLNNYFKATFELIKCSHLSPTFANQFQIFKRKIEIHQLQFQSYLKNSGSASLKIDILKVFYYERLYLKFQLQESLTVHSTISFWKELLQKQFNSTSLHKSGMDISKRYEQIQNAAMELQKINPEDINFLYRYGKLLIYIINNEFEGMECFRKIQGIYVSKIQLKNNISESKEQFVFGDNAGAAVMIISASMSNYGQIVHASDEVQNILGFSRQDLLGQNVGCIMTPSVGQNHDKFLKKYLETGKQRIIDKQLELFAVTKEGYCKIIDIVVKIYPHIYSSIIFIGMFKQRDTMDAMEPPVEDLKSYEQHLIITDKNGYIANMTEGLTKEIGLHPKLFQYNQDLAQRTMINIQSLLIMKSEEGVDDVLEPNGSAFLSVDTRQIRTQLDIEKLSSEELAEITANLGVYSAFAQMKKYEFQLQPENIVFYVYRLIFCQPTMGINGEISSFSKKLGLKQRQTSKIDIQRTSYPVDMLASNEIEEEESQNTMGSVSAGSITSTDNIISNFKKSLGERKTPKKLNILNKLIVFILLCMITLQSVDFAIQLKITDIVEHDNFILYNCQLRAYYMMYMIQYTSNYLNLAAGNLFIYYPLIEFNYYVNKFTNVGRLLQIFANNLQQVYNTINELRSDGVYANDKLMSDYEYQAIPIYMMDEANIVQLIQQPYRVAMEEFLIGVQTLNNTNQAQATLPLVLLCGDPSIAIGQKQISTTSVEKAGWAAMVNSVRSLRTFSDNSTSYYQQLAQNNLTLEPFLIIMIVGALLTVASIIVVLYLIWINERIQEDILSLYSQIQVRHIVQVYNRCHQYMKELQQRSFFAEEPQSAKRRGRYDREEFKDDHPQNYQDEHKKNKNDTLFGKIVKLTVKEMQNVHDQNTQCKEEEMLRNKSETEIQIYQSEQIKKRKRKHIKKVEKMNEEKHKSASKKVMNAFKVGKKMANTFGREIEEEEKVEDSSDVDSSRSSLDFKKDEIKKPVDKNKKREKVEDDDFQDKQEENQRLQQKFSKSFQTHNIGRKAISVIVGLAMFSYFIVVYFMQNNFNLDSQAVQQAYSPIFEREITQFITRVLQKNRVYYNNSMISFENDPVYGNDIDMKVYYQSVANENIIAELKQNHRPIANNIVNNLVQQDSNNFCSYFIGTPTNYTSQPQSQSNISTVNFNGFNSYQQQIMTVIAACRAAFNGDITTLQNLFRSNVDLNQMDYSSRSPLHYAVRGNMTTSVQFLINSGVNLNQADLWQGRPLDYALVNSTIYKLLINNHAQAGAKPKANPALPFTLTDNQARMFYAAYNNDVLSAQILQQLNLPVNAMDIDGRTSLHVAAMQGNLEMTQFLINLGADGTITDAYGNDALKDAQNGGFGTLSQYILDVIINVLIQEYCTTYDAGVITKGELAIVGEFDESTVKLYIDTINTPTYAARLLLLKGAYLSNGINYVDPIAKLVTYQFTLPQYIGGFQDMFMAPVFDDLFNQVTTTIDSMNSNQYQYSKITFALFIIFEVFLLIFIRKILMVRLREDILESRGILNMIPNNIIYQNKTAMESIIKKLQD